MMKLLWCRNVALLALMSVAAITTACIIPQDFTSRRESGHQQPSGNQPTPSITPMPIPTYNNPAPTPQPFAMDCLDADPVVCEISKMIFEQTNQYRIQKGKQLLQMGVMMSYVARRWSRVQAESRKMYHANDSQRMSLLQEGFRGAQFEMNAENVAMSSFSSRATPQEIAMEFATMWWESPGHKSNMLSKHKTIGVGVWKSPSGSSYYATQIFGDE